MIISPTRELSSQIYKVALPFISALPNLYEFRGNECQDKDPCGLLVKDIRKEGMYMLHLSGDDDSPLTGTPSCEKVHHPCHTV